MVLWGVGGTLVDYALIASEFLARALGRAGVKAREIPPENVAAAQEEVQGSSSQTGPAAKDARVEKAQGGLSRNALVTTDPMQFKR